MLAKYVDTGREDGFALADAAFRRALALNPELTVAHKLYAQLESDIPSVVPLVSDENGEPRVDVQVTIDNELLTSRLDGRALPIDPGMHEFSFTADGAVLATQRLMIVQGQRNRPIAITLQKRRRAALGPSPATSALDAKASLDKPGVDKMAVEKTEREAPPERAQALDRDLDAAVTTAIDAVKANFQAYQVSLALQDAWTLVRQVNKYIVEREPWKLAKDTKNADLLNQTLYRGADALRVIAALVDPVAADISAALDPRRDALPYRLAADMLTGVDAFGMEFIDAYRSGKLA